MSTKFVAQANANDLRELDIVEMRFESRVFLSNLIYRLQTDCLVSLGRLVIKQNGNVGTIQERICPADADGFRVGLLRFQPWVGKNVHCMQLDYTWLGKSCITQSTAHRMWRAVRRLSLSAGL